MILIFFETPMCVYIYIYIYISNDDNSHPNNNDFQNFGQYLPLKSTEHVVYWGRTSDNNTFIKI